MKAPVGRNPPSRGGTSRSNSTSHEERLSQAAFLGSSSRPRPTSPLRTRPVWHSSWRSTWSPGPQPSPPMPGPQRPLCLWGWVFSQLTPIPNGVSSKRRGCPFLAFHGDQPPSERRGFSWPYCRPMGVGLQFTERPAGSGRPLLLPPGFPRTARCLPWPVRTPTLCPEASRGSHHTAFPQVCTGDRDSHTCHNILLNKVISVPQGNVGASSQGRAVFSPGRAAPSCGAG